MAYPQPGQFPAYPQYPGQAGMPAKPPVPNSVQNAFRLMLGGAAVALINGIVALASTSKVRDTVRSQHPEFTSTQVDNAVRVGVAAAVIGVLIGIGLWLWMAFAIRAGKNWARITGTVFFGISCLTLLGTLVASSTSAFGTAKASGFGVALTVISWLIGLAVVVLVWNKESSPYFRGPQYGAAPYPYPYPMQTPPPTAQGTQQSPYDQPPQQPPGDPWSNPPR
jgi:hypothetical protein